MQNNKFKGLRTFVKEKGYYIVLLLCAAAVGVSGYFLLTGKQDATPVDVKTTTASTPSPSLREPSREAVATQGSTTPPTEARMTVCRPVDGEALTEFSVDRLAYNETTRDWRTHEGVDLSAATGQEVLAAADGTVHTIYEDKSFGMTVVLRHANGYTTHYSNLAEEVSVRVGDSVSAGDVLGTVGQTANIETATAPHLHFAVYCSNIPTDPLAFLSEE